MDARFNHTLEEQKLYSFWEQAGYLKPKSNKKPFTILMPPPNANASLHAGHGMYTIDDIMIRYKRIMGFDSLWIPGTDHAGFETQFVYEKYLSKMGKSRLDFDRESLYENIFTFVQENSGLIVSQLKRLGLLADWDRSIFTLNDQVIQQVFDTFQKMVTDGLVYRDEYIVNYCTHCGTTLADLEAEYVERIDPLYYITYGPFTIATVRPETKFGDTAVAVNPQDKRFTKWIGKKIKVVGLLGEFELEVIADDFVDPKFGTGVVKVTPAHDKDDFEMGKKHNLETKQIIDLTGRLSVSAGKYAGLSVKKAREAVVEDLKKKGLLEKIDETYTHNVTVCYKCKRDLEPMIFPNWFIRVLKLKTAAKKAVQKNLIHFFPIKYKKQMLDWLDVMHDWPISRQIVWGIRIPVWYKIDKNTSTVFVWFLDKNKTLQTGTVGSFLRRGVSITEIEKGLQKVMAKTGENAVPYVISTEKPSGGAYLPETDTFDTWFSSGQWPLETLHTTEYDTRFPTDFMGTMADILRLWISRMIMFSLYLKKEIPFKTVYLWSTVMDSRGVKMSKSKGNVINPIDFIDKYGADALRASLLFGVEDGGKIQLSEDKVRAMRNFANKIWNIGRFIYINKTQNNPTSPTLRQGFGSGTVKLRGAGVQGKEQIKILTELEEEFKTVKGVIIQSMESYHFSRAFDKLYEFIWHRFADYYIEKLKTGLQSGDQRLYEGLESVFLETIRLLHPFVPFVTESIWKVFHGENTSILDATKSK